MKKVATNWRAWMVSMLIGALVCGCIQFGTSALWPTFLDLLFVSGFAYCAGRVDRERERLERKLKRFDRKEQEFNKQK